MAAPLVILERALALVRAGRFDPDDTRSGRWKAAASPSSAAASVPVGIFSGMPDFDIAVPPEPTAASSASSHAEAEVVASPSPSMAVATVGAEALACLICHEAVQGDEWLRCDCGATVHNEAPCFAECEACGQALCFVCPGAWRA